MRLCFTAMRTSAASRIADLADVVHTSIDRLAADLWHSTGTAADERALRDDRVEARGDLERYLAAAPEGLDRDRAAWHLQILDTINNHDAHDMAAWWLAHRDRIESEVPAI